MCAGDFYLLTMADTKKDSIDWGAVVTLTPDTMSNPILQKAMQKVYKSETGELRKPTKERLMQIILQVGAEKILEGEKK